MLLTKFGLEERIAEHLLAVHQHIMHFPERRRGLGDELESLSTEAQVAQAGVAIVELLLRVLDLFAQAMDEMFD